MVEALRGALIAADGAPESPFGEVDGRVDLRGLPLTPKPSKDRVTVGSAQGSRWVGLDLSGADLREMNWIRHTVTDCVLDDADLTNLRCWGVAVTQVSLRRAGLHHAQLGARMEDAPKSHWFQVDLTSADLRASTASHATLESVDVGGAKLAGAHWNDLVDVTFRGVVQGLTLGRGPTGSDWDDTRLRGIDLSAARLRDVRFLGVDLGQPEVDIRFPDGDEHWWIDGWPGFLGQVRSRLDGVTDDELRLVAGIWVDRAQAERGPRQTAGVVVRHDLTALGGEGLVGLLDDVRAGFRRAR